MAKHTLPKSWTTVTPFSTILAIILFVVLPFACFFLGMEYQKKITPQILSPQSLPQPTQAPMQTQCTMEAKLCHDGSSVGRSGPNCEFAACPN